MASVVANRYARALADVVARTGEYHKTLEEIEDFAALLRESAELREVCETPAVTMTQKANVLDTILTRLGVSRVTRDFLRVLLSHYRMSLLEEVIPAFRKISDDRLGVVRVRVFSASELSEADRKALGERFGELTKKQAEMEFLLDHSLIGGILAQIGSTVYDGSIRGRLDRFREELMAR